MRGTEGGRQGGRKRERQARRKAGKEGETKKKSPCLRDKENNI